MDFKNINIVNKIEIVLLIQSFGDLVIALNFFNLRKIYIAHRSLRPLITAMGYEKNFIFFGKSREIFPLYDLKNSFFSIFRLKEVFYLREIIKNNVNNVNINTITIPKIRLINFICLGLNVKFENDRKYDENIYKWWGRTSKVRMKKKEFIHQQKKTILIFPDSRVKSKIIKLENIILIKSFLKKYDFKLKVCHFGKTYKNFEQLIYLIKSSSIIFSSDSLPLHLAYFYQIVHIALYNNEMNKEFLSPFSKKNNIFIENIDLLSNQKINTKLTKIFEHNIFKNNFVRG